MRSQFGSCPFNSFTQKVRKRWTTQKVRKGVQLFIYFLIVCHFCIIWTVSKHLPFWFLWIIWSINYHTESFILDFFVSGKMCEFMQESQKNRLSRPSRWCPRTLKSSPPWWPTNSPAARIPLSRWVFQVSLNSHGSMMYLLIERWIPKLSLWMCQF